jgi:hypothetical protein
MTCPPSTRPLRERESWAAAAKGGQEMPRGKAEQAEVIILKLREVEVELGRGKTVAEAVNEDRRDGADPLPLEEEVRRFADGPKRSDSRSSRRRTLG